MQDAALTREIIGCALNVHQTLGPGSLESVFSKAPARELDKAGLQVECHQAIKVACDGIVAGDFVPDVSIADTVLVENKAVKASVQAC
jgi:GxxExxY protein